MDNELSRRGMLLAAAGGILAAAGCTSAHTAGPPSSPRSRSGSGPDSPATSSTPATTSAPSTSAPAGTSVPATTSPHASTSTAMHQRPDPRSVRANELGVVPVMMYHRLTADPGEYDMTPKALTAQLHRLFTAGYRPVNAIDLATGHIDIPAGTTPVVFTFDDGTDAQFRLLPDGSLDPTCSAGIITAVCRQYEDCVPRATFYVNHNPFGQVTAGDQRKTLNTLLRLGFLLGNHTYDHANLGLISGTDVQREFIELQQLVHTAAPAAQLNTMALPFGVAPRDDALARTGSWHGQHYRFDITLLVGANPSLSPYDRNFDPHAVARIRGTSYQGGRTPLTGTYWLDYLDAHPHQRYISAGNPGKVTVPVSMRNQLAPGWRHDAVLY